MCYVLTDPSVPIVGGLSYPQTNGEMFPKSRRVDFPAVDAFSRECCLQAGVAPHRPSRANVFQSDLRSLKHGIPGWRRSWRSPPASTARQPAMILVLDPGP